MARPNGPTHRELLERTVLERVGRVADLDEVALGEHVSVGDEHAAGRQVGDVGLERGRVHRDEHAGAVTGREDVVVGEEHLER
jgi:hypothetical protein